MSWYAKAVKKNIPPGSTDPDIKPIGVILHVAESNSSSLFDYFNGPSGGIESHFYIRTDGSVEQYRDTAFEADANYHGNRFIKDGVAVGYISVETQGLELGEWSPAQLAAIKDLLLWANKEHGIPLKRCASATDPGIGYHTMFGAPGPWTPASKSCPGPQRKMQFANVLVPWMATALSPATPPKEDDMPSPEDYAKAVWNYDGIKHNKPGAVANTDSPTDPSNPTWRASSTLENAENLLRVLVDKVAKLEAKVNAFINAHTDDGR